MKFMDCLLDDIDGGWVVADLARVALERNEWRFMVADVP